MQSQRTMPEMPERAPRLAQAIFLFNAGARLTGLGARTPEYLEQAMRKRGVAACVVAIDDDEDASSVAERVAREEAGVVVAVGGEGTVDAVAAGLVRAGST